jgi:NADPH-dependent curcumin reductase CurA
VLRGGAREFKMCLSAALSSSIVSQKQVTKISLLKRMFLELVFHFGLGVEQVDLLIKTMGYDAAFNYKEESDFSAALKKYAPDLLLVPCENMEVSSEQKCMLKPN